ncbi:hypothetical protein LBMAG42_14090 [Deltaproteobacteria bacterium]|nr:hypothetical protein LBMAG42_14090 [Deltaproteobacteria bacterium]
MGGFVGRLGEEDPATTRRMARMLDARGPAARWERHADATSFIVVASGSPALDEAIGASEGVVAAVEGHVPNRKALAAEQDLGDDAPIGEVVARLIARTGFARAFARLPGDVALAAWQPALGNGWLARDRAGVRPLAWAPVSGGIAFATEARALHAAGFAGPPSARALATTVGLGCALESAYEGSQTLAAGEILSVRATETRTERSAWPSAHPPGAAGNFERWSRSVRYGLDLAYSVGGRAALPHAIALSGGLASAALLAVRPRDAAPALALTLVAGGRRDADVGALAASAGLPLREVVFDASVLDQLADEVAPHPAWVQPEAWAWAALAQAAWREGLVGLVAGIGARVGFDPPAPRPLLALRSRLRQALGADAVGLEALARSLGPWLPGDDAALEALSRRLDGVAPAVRRAGLGRGLRLPEVELAALDAGCAAFGVHAVVPFADPALLAVACEVPVGAHHYRARRALLASVAAAPPREPLDWSLDVPTLIRAFALDTLPERLRDRLDAEHVRSVVAAALAGDERCARRVFALEMVARGLVG